MNRLTLGSLFDGIGGWLLAATHAEVEPIWASEIDPYPASVTAKHFPNVKQLGDITKLNGAELEPVDIICAGSPCQDLSISGKREGLAGERSGLFYAAIKLVRDMRKATNGKYPKFFVWENVMGAFSSNKGLDFKAVLEEITEAEIPMPSSGRWATAGVVRNRECYLEWRVLDAQYWGVPQRRKRIFLVADFIGGGRGEILFEPTSLRGNPTESNNKEENITTPARENIDATVYENHANDSRVTERKKVADTLTQRMGTGGGNVPFKIDATNGKAIYVLNKVSYFTRANVNVVGTLVATDYKDAPAVFDENNMLRVRKLTPLECERLQGLPDNYTKVNDKTPDSKRYKAIGNGMAQPCADYVIKRIVEYAKERARRKNRTRD